jgi:Fe2+ transport system protein B
MEKSLEELEQEINEKKQQQIVKVSQEQQNYALQEKMTGAMMGLMENSMKKNEGELQQLTDQALKNEIDIRKTQTEGRKQKEKIKVEKEVTEAKTEEDSAKHERAKTILKAMGLTKQMPKIFRSTALIVGYPFYVLYLFTLGWIMEFVSFVVQGFITLVADCSERFADVQKKFIDNNNNKTFNLGRTIKNICWGILIIGVAIGLICLFVLK